MIFNWKKQTVKQMQEIFSGKHDQVDKNREAEIKELHAKIGQLTIEKDFKKKVWDSKLGAKSFDDRT